MSLGKMIEWDGKIPVWGLLMLGLAQVAYGYNAFNDLDKRVSMSEQRGITGRARLDQIEVKIGELGAMKGDINVLKELLVRIERKLDQSR